MRMLEAVEVALDPKQLVVVVEAMERISKIIMTQLRSTIIVMKNVIMVSVLVPTADLGMRNREDLK